MILKLDCFEFMKFYNFTYKKLCSWLEIVLFQRSEFLIQYLEEMKTEHEQF